MSDATQGKLFDDTGTLPLFSGVPESVDASPYIAQECGGQQLHYAECGLCLDTGCVDDHCCWCEAGQKARAYARELVEMEQRAKQSARWLSPKRAHVLEL